MEKEREKRRYGMGREKKTDKAFLNWEDRRGDWKN